MHTIPQKKFKILFIKVPEIDFEDKKINYSEVLSLKAPPIPLGIASLSAYLKQKSNNDIEIFDIYLQSFKEYRDNKNQDIFFDLIKEKIKDGMPDVLCISALMIINYRWVHYIAGMAKRINPQIKTIVGGGYASILPQKVLKDHSIDFIAIGEAEEVLLTILNRQCIRENLVNAEGVGFINERGDMIINRRAGFINNIETLPFFDWHGIGLENYLEYTDGTVSYVTSRGCPFRCTFCSTYLMWGRKFRPFSARRVLDEIDYLVSTYSIKHVEFRDDNLALDKDRIIKILKAFVERRYNLKWSCPNALAVVTIHKEMLELFKKSGLEMLTIAVESGSERVTKDIIHKPVDKKKVKEIVKFAKEIGLKVQTAFIVGFPGETREEIEETRNFILELQCDWNQISIATPFPGTEMYKICRENNYFVNPEMDLDRFRYGFANVRTKDFDEKWIKQKAYDINIEANFLKNHNFNDDSCHAATEYSGILINYPKHLIALFCLAYAYKKNGERKKERETLNRALHLIHTEPDIYETYKKYIDRFNPIFESYFSLLGKENKQQNS